MVKAKASGKSTEVTSLTTETTLTIANPDGTFTLKSNPRPVRVKQGNSWRAVDNTLVRRADGSITPKASAIPMRFSGGGNDPLATLTRDGSTMAFSWRGHSLPEPALAGDTATYAEVLPGVDLVVRADIDAFTEVLVVKTRAAATNPQIRKLTFDVAGDGLAITRTAEGALVAKNHKGQAAFTSPSPTMWDSSGIAATRNGRIDRTQPGAKARNASMKTTLSGKTVTVTPDPAILDSPGTTFPVQIDPAWSGGKLAWAYVSTSNAGAAHYNTTEDARVGHEDWDGSTKRSFFRMSTTGVAGKRIIRSSLWLNSTWSWSCSARGMQVWATNGIGTTTTWNNQPTWSYKLAEKSFAYGWAQSGQSSSCPNPAGGVEFRVDALVKSAAAGKWSNITLGLRATSETDEFGWKRFRNNPTLSITYDTPPAVPTSAGTVPGTTCTGGTIGNTDVSLRAIPQDADGGTITARFSYSKNGGTWVAKDVNAVSGQYATLAFGRTLSNPDAVNTIRWQVQTRSKDIDGVVQQSLWTPVCSFSIDAKAPVADVDVTSPTYSACTDPTGLPQPCAGGVAGVPATFVFKPKDPSTVAVKVGFDDDTPTYQFNVSSTGTTMTFTPTSIGPNVMHVKTVDAAGNVSTSTDADFEIFAASPLTGQDPISHDLTSDGMPDLMLDRADGRNCLYLGNGAGNFLGGNGCSIEVTEPVGSLYAKKPVQVGDWDADGINDLVVLSSGKLFLVTGRGAGRFNVQEEIKSDISVMNPDDPTDVGYEPITFTGLTDIYGPGDWDGDGHVDLLARKSDGSMHAIFSNGNGSVVTKADKSGLHTLGANWSAYRPIATGDVTGDGAQDVVLAQIASPGSMYVCRTTAITRDTTSWATCALNGTGWSAYSQIFPLGRFNGDATSDIAAVPTNGDLWYYNGTNDPDGNPVFNPRTLIGTSWLGWLS